MVSAKNIKIIIGLIFILLISIFLWFFFKYFSIDDFTSYELIKANKDSLNEIKQKNIIMSSIIFFLFTILWVLLLGFGSPIFLVGGFIFGKWLGTILVLFGLTSGATLLYIFANYLLKDFIFEKFSSRFYFLVKKFKEKEFIYFIVYRAVGGIPFFLQNIIPTLFNISTKKYFFGSLIGLAPQLFIGVSLGSGINKLIDENDNMPTFIDMIFNPNIYIPIIGLLIIFFITLIIRKKFFKKD